LVHHGSQSIVSLSQIHALTSYFLPQAPQLWKECTNARDTEK